RFRYPKTLPAVPRTRARVLVALAMIAGVPKKIRLGKVSRVPPPATALMAPAATAALRRPRISVADKVEGLKFEVQSSRRKIERQTNGLTPPPLRGEEESAHLDGALHCNEPAAD